MIWTERLKAVFEMDTILLYELYLYEIQQGVLGFDIQLALQDPSCIFVHKEDTNVSPNITDPGSVEKCALFDSVLKPWLICYELQYKLKLIHVPLPEAEQLIPDHIDLLPYTTRTALGESRILPCLIQITNNDRIEPPINVYMVPDFDSIVLLKVDPHLLAKAIVFIQKPLYSMTFTFLQDINAIHFKQASFNFCKSTTRSSFKGYNVFRSIDTHWECRIIFSNSRLFDRAKDWVFLCHYNTIENWKKRITEVLL
jgi:hypothetical protein